MSEIRNAIPEAAQIPSSDYVIIGGTGDLSLRKIFPALFQRFVAGQIDSTFRLVVAARQTMSAAEYADKIRPFCHLDTAADQSSFAEFMQLVSIIPLDVVAGDGAEALAAFISAKQDDARPVIYYLAISPALFGSACQLLDKHGLVTPSARLVVEKPLGHDSASAGDLNDQLLAVFSEDNIYRIDHYLGKETVQNLMALRFANTIFESQWNNTFIDHVQITVAESVGLEGRAAYYDRYGAMRDMIQNHLMQLLCLVAMEPPSQFKANQVRDEKLRVLRALRPFDISHLSDHLVIGQYGGGDDDVSYAEALGQSSKTETFVALKLFIENWRWAGVPFYMRTGKKLQHRASEIVITFKRPSHNVFANGAAEHESEPNRLIIRLQPQEGLRLQLISKQPGPGGMRLFPSELNLSFDETFKERLPDAYERLLMDVARGNQTLFMRHDEVMAAWQFMDPIIAAAAAISPDIYPSGSMGPEGQAKLFGAHEASWIDPISESEG